MADTVVFQPTVATPPDGTVISTEEVTTLNGGAVSAQQVQRTIVSLRTANATAVDVTSADPLPVTAATMPLPTGAATATNQATEIASLALLDDAVSTTGSAVPAKGFQATGTDGTNARALKTDANGELQIDVLSSALPSGASTSAKQDSEITLLAGGLPAALGAGGGLKVDGSGMALPVSLGSVPLPTGAATLAEQQTQTTALQLIDDAVSTTGSAVPAKGMQATGTDGTNARALKTDTNGELQIDVLSSALPSGASTLAEQQTQTTSLQLLDDAVSTTGSAVPAKGFQATGTDGTNARALKTDASGELQIDVLSISAGSNLIGYVGQKLTYTNKVTLTTTNFTSLANGSGWQSVAIDTTGARDVQFEIQTKGQAGSTAYVNFYLAETLTNGTVYTDGATGSEGTFTAANRLNSRFLGSILCNTTTAVQGAFKLSDIFAVIPNKVALIAINNSGGAMSATGGDHVFEYGLVN